MWMLSAMEIAADKAVQGVFHFSVLEGFVLFFAEEKVGCFCSSGSKRQSDSCKQ